MGSLWCDGETMTAHARELSAQGAIDVREAFIGASFAPAKKGGARSEKRNAALVILRRSRRPKDLALSPLSTDPGLIASSEIRNKHRRPVFLY